MSNLSTDCHNLDRNGSAHATKVPGLIFLSGQVPSDKSGKIVDGGIQEHTVRGLLVCAEVYLLT